jgi:hypothetical protein
MPIKRKTKAERRRESVMKATPFQKLKVLQVTKFRSLKNCQSGRNSAIHSATVVYVTPCKRLANGTVNKA